MKNITKLLILATLILMLSAQIACAEPGERLKGIFDALTAADSDYTKMKALYTEYSPEAKFEETLADDSFTISISGIEYMVGSRTFTEDGDYLTTTIPAQDFTGAYLASMVLDAVGDYYDMNKRLLTPYINGLSMMKIENDYFITQEDEEAGTTTISINIAGPYDMKELDQMVINEETMGFFEPLNENHISNVTNVGKLFMVANGSVNDETILLGEYGGLDDLAYQSIINIVTALQPKGWEKFIAEYKELTDAATDDYTVTLNIDESKVREIIDEVPEGNSYALFRFGE